MALIAARNLGGFEGLSRHGNTIQKVIFIAILVAVVPIMGLYLIMPRLAIATGGMNIGFADLTVANFTSEDPFFTNPNITDNMTLDFWLEAGLAVKNNDLTTTVNRNGTAITMDTRYYTTDGYVNLANLEDPSSEVIVPQLGLRALFRGQEVGTGGSRKIYVLNSQHPVEYVHLYLTGSREPDSGLMTMFNAITTEGGLDQLLLGALGGGGGLDLGALLSDLQLIITAYIGSAPLELSISTSFFGLSSLPVINNAKGTIETVQATSYPIISYQWNRSIINSMDRFMSQLGLDTGYEQLLVRLGLMRFENDEYVYEATTINNAVNQIFDAHITNESIYTLPLETSEKWWVEPTKNLSNGEAYNQSTMKGYLYDELAQLKIANDTEDRINLAVAGTYADNETAWLNYITTTIQSYSDANARDRLDADFESRILNNANSWYNKLFHVADNVEATVDVNFQEAVIFGVTDKPVLRDIYNSYFGKNITVELKSDLLNIFKIMNIEGYNIGDLFLALNKTVPDVLTSLLFSDVNATRFLLGEDYGEEAPQNTVAPAISGIQSSSLVIVIVIVAFIITFVIFSITKGTVTINRREFLGREDVQRNVNNFIKQVEQLGGKVSVQNAESLIIRAFKQKGGIEKSSDVETRAKSYVENQKLLVTLQSRASRAYVAQKFKDCIAAIEKMIDIAKKLEDQTLVSNYQDNLDKVVKLLRRKGIAVKTKERLPSGEGATDEVEQLRIYKKDLVDLQNKASRLFAEKNWPEAKNCIKEMLAIAKKIQDPVLIRNYEANLRKIIAMEKGGTV